MNNKIKIKTNPNGDTRTALKNISFKQFHEANLSHISDVKRVMRVLGTELTLKGISHDFTKIAYEEEFYKDFLATMNEGKDFVSGDWYQKHIHEEKHHPFSYCHDDINLLDIIETIVDCVCAGKARSGEIRPLEFNMDILQKAVINTTKLIDQMVEVEK